MSDWNSIITTTVDLKDDYDILDIVNVTVAGNTWKDEAKGLGLDIATGWLNEGDVSTVFTVASALLKSTANEIGADAVVGCEFDVGFDNSGPYVVGFGTAVKLK
jgi:uncharacterized protein YbjQ (UPF0145 family)|tara:strand:- start:2490 stop:2801 length:312 start_codon:yes stop_codon:yes gene_type:complete